MEHFIPEKFRIQGCFFAILLFFTTLAKPTLSTDPRFEACAPTTCGKGPNISFPFWVSDVQDSYCGYPNFKLTCDQQEYPLFTISDEDYIIEDIFYTNHSFLVANAAAYVNTCPIPLHNISLDRTAFNISPGYTNFSFMYYCTSKPEGYDASYPINCASNATSYSFASFHIEMLEAYNNVSIDSCHYFVNAPLHISGGLGGLFGKNYSEILKMGFLLNWTAHNCSTCERSGGRCGFDNNEFVCFCDDGPQSKSCVGKGVNWKLIVGITVPSFVCVAILCGALFIYFRRKKKQYAPSSYVSRSTSSGFYSMAEMGKGGVHIFTYGELQDATKNFNSANELGDGGFGTVYYGKLRDGREVAVKRLYENNCKRVEQFMNEIKILTRLRHRNLVSLYGCTSRHSRELLLVYEYISNGTVADHLHGEKAKPGGLPWHTRMKIAVETASALTYLHASDIIHRDVKTYNILLEKDFCVKVADFGLSRLFPTDVTHVSTAPQGTPGYVDPDYHQCYQLTVKSDVYSFGVVLVELISSMPAVDITRHRHEINLSNMAINKIQSNALHELVDKNLGFESDYAIGKQITAVAELAFNCLQCEKALRPSMFEVLQNLKEIQSGDYNIGKTEEIDGPSDDIELLKNGPLMLSPNSVTIKWNSNSSASNASG